MQLKMCVTSSRLGSIIPYLSEVFLLQILEESPCKRWSKRREQVKQRDVPGIDVAYLAMDNETGESF